MIQSNQIASVRSGKHSGPVGRKNYPRGLNTSANHRAELGHPLGGGHPPDRIGVPRAESNPRRIEAE